MFKILLNRRSSSTDPLFSFYKILSEEKPDIMEDFETEDETLLVEKVKELLNTMPRNSINIVNDMNYDIDIILGL